MGGMVTIEHEACPECASTDVKPFWWHRGQAWIIVCDECKHEEGREASEWQAWAVWDDAARTAGAAPSPVPESDGGGVPPAAEPLSEVPGDDGRPFVDRLTLVAYTDRCGDVHPEARAHLEGEYVAFDEHRAALAFEEARYDALHVAVAEQAAEIARLKKAAGKVRRPPVRTYWTCKWSSRERYAREGRDVVSTSATFVGLFDDLAAKRIAHIRDEESFESVTPSMEPVGDVVFSYGPVRHMAVEEERAFDECEMMASTVWSGFHAKVEERRLELERARQAAADERAVNAEANERAEYERLRAKFEQGERT